MIEADPRITTPPLNTPIPHDVMAAPARADDLAGMAWWNSLTERDRRHWMRLAGDTGRAVDAWQAYERLSLAGRDLDPADVIAEILEEHLIPDPRAVADAIVEHLRDAGFEIKSIDPKRRA